MEMAWQIKVLKSPIKPNTAIPTRVEYKDIKPKSKKRTNDTVKQLFLQILSIIDMLLVTH